MCANNIWTILEQIKRNEFARMVTEFIDLGGMAENKQFKQSNEQWLHKKIFTTNTISIGLQDGQ